MMKSYIQLSKEYKDLEPIIKAFKEYAGLIDNIEEAKDIISNSDDIEMKEMARSELDLSLNRKVVMDDEIKLLLIPKDPATMKKMLLWKLELEQVVMKQVFLLEIYSTGCILLIRPQKGWKIEIVDIAEGTVGGYKEIIFNVLGEDVYGQLKFESGVHRVQVPDAGNSRSCSYISCHRLWFTRS